MDPCVKHNAKYNSFMIKNKNKTNLKNLIVLEIFLQIFMSLQHVH